MYQTSEASGATSTLTAMFCACDPTNGIWMAGDHIVMAVGRDYAEIAPVDGVVLGSQAQNMAVSVDVAPLASDV